MSQSEPKITEFIAGLPKAELHLHIEGSLEPDMLFDLARRNQIEIPFSSVEEIRNAYQFSNLQDFLDIYYQGMQVLVSVNDFYDLTKAYLSRAAAENVRHVEIFFDPQAHTTRGVPFDTVIQGILQALEDTKSEVGVTYRLIMCFLRHLDEESAFCTLKEAEPWLDYITGVGLDSSEMGHPPSKFKAVFEECRKRGLKLVAHAGEEGPPSYIWEALDLLKIDRIDHGNRCLEDPQLVNRIAGDGLTLTVCPLSNLKLCVIDALECSPIKEMLQRGLKPTINSDDPAYFGGYVNANYSAVANALSLGIGELAQLAANSFTGSFLPQDEIETHLSEIDRYVSAWKAG